MNLYKIKTVLKEEEAILLLKAMQKCTKSKRIYLFCDTQA
jgi:hypothetical protein